MLDITRIIKEVESRSEHVRYAGSRDLDAPVSLVVWNTTPACNLTCKHCYFAACDERSPEEFSTAEAKSFIDELADLGVPGIVFSGGEPFVRDDLADLVAHATERGIRAIGSSNGTFLTSERAQEIADAGMRYVGVSLDGIGETHDRFRGFDGAFDRALSGLRNAMETEMSAGIRFTMTEDTIDDLPDVIDLALEEDVDRLTIFHLIHVGRGTDIVDRDLSLEQTREAVEYIYDRTKEIVESDPDMRVLTGGNTADAVYLYHRIAEDMPQRADRARDLLLHNRTGRELINVNHRGDVYPSMGMTEFTLGNVREQSLDEILAASELWSKLTNPTDHLKGRCGECPYRTVCGGNSRARAHIVHNDLWDEDPRCYLTDEELGLTPDTTVPEFATSEG
ncbi:MAG: radical SAM protein [Halobacteriales archaeon]|nr:radical SAM protein [Halobacteriales archaeon]